MKKYDIGFRVPQYFGMPITAIRDLVHYLGTNGIFLSEKPETDINPTTLKYMIFGGAVLTLQFYSGDAKNNYAVRAECFSNQRESIMGLEKFAADAGFIMDSRLDWVETDLKNSNQIRPTFREIKFAFD